MGFSVPIDRWLRGPLKEGAGYLLGAAVFHRTDTTPAALGRLWDEYLAGRGTSAQGIWTLVVLSAWTGSVYQSGASDRPPPPPLPQNPAR